MNVPGGYREPISDEVKALVLAEYTAGNPINRIALNLELSWATVKKIVTQYQPELDAIRAEERKELVASGVRAAQAYLERLSDPAVVQATKARDAAIIYGILMDKSQKEQELAVTFELMLDEARDMILEESRSQLGDDSELRIQLKGIIEQAHEMAKHRVQQKIEERTDAIRYRARRYRAKDDAIECVTIGGSSIPVDTFMQFMAGIDVDMQLKIMESWEQQGA